ncbi:helix-turn-helix transcriptional regulator [Streptomyces sp. NPDC051917]|uniref:helix-turn-helix transcriptional regulator n=1 Tax=Streptomyces sp. NPDC051917 TaxID=3154754 RepID=UPI0034540F17
MRDEQNGHNPALTELRRMLNSGLARMRLNKTALARRADLGRTTVSQAFQTNGPVPSAQTVAALARALKLPVEELLALQRDAAGGGGGERPMPGRLIAEWEPHDLEVHLGSLTWLPKTVRYPSCPVRIGSSSAWSQPAP